jgi:hypothetical protein
MIELRRRIMEFHEHAQADGTIEVSAEGKPLTCVVCGSSRFCERNYLLNTRGATFFNFDWANSEATNYVCSKCGYVFWFAGV